MLDLVDKEDYEDGNVIFEEGTSEDRIYVVLSGSVEISKKANNKKHIIEMLEEGDVFGGASFLGGEFQANYLQSTNTDPLVASTSWKAGRVVTILDLELGLGWTSCKGCFRATADYMVSAWLNTPKTEDFIRAVQNNDFGTLGGSEAGRLTFDGPTARVELRY